MSSEEGQGVQVLLVEKSADGSRKYRLDEAALESLLLRDEVSTRRVAVVSVAGAYRGGKSFLLDLFLRYLSAPPHAHADGSWLGVPDAPLTGFSWRGGSERNTTGMLLWSQPLQVTLPSGETVLVLLMDTQGTFDNYSTVRDYSTVFALSALLSSTLIYNIKEGDIREDCLQHLQLFTEYGQLVSEAGAEKPFQDLKFLVRDWSYDYEYAFGADGGRQLLEKRLQVDSEQALENQELRQHILASFENVDCFLMPHPGRKVAADPRFDGRLADVGAEFRDSLLELVPMIFSPENLKVKMIEGRPLNGRDLFHYFKSYVDTFNSDGLVKPLTIKEATTEASLAVAASEARAHYTVAMQRVCDERLPCVTRAALRERHDDARDAALALAAAVQTMASANRREAWHTMLREDLDAQLPTYNLLNERKIEKGIADAKNAYEAGVQRVTGNDELCVHPEDLRNLHDDWMTEAMEVFDASRTAPEGEDGSRQDMLTYFEERFHTLQEPNERNNNTFAAKARDAFLSLIARSCGDQPCMDPNDLRLKHSEASGGALGIFMTKRNRPTVHTDSYMDQLTECFNQTLSSLQNINKNNNEEASQAAVSTYEQAMNRICNENLPCLHPKDLEELHEDTLRIALDGFRDRRTRASAENDEYFSSIQRIILQKYTSYEATNESLNSNAVTEGYNEYCNEIYNNTFRVFSIMDPRSNFPMLNNFMEIHENARRSGVRRFTANRRPTQRIGDDPHLDTFNQRVQEQYIYYSKLITALYVATVVGVAGSALVL